MRCDKLKKDTHTHIEKTRIPKQARTSKHKGTKANKNITELQSETEPEEEFLIQSSPKNLLEL